MDIYVYYRAAADKAAQVQAEVAALQSALSREHGVAASLKRRPAAENGAHTWMEVYAGVPENFTAILEAALSHCGLPALIDGPRHVEQFLDVPTCA